MKMLVDIEFYLVAMLLKTHREVREVRYYLQRYINYIFYSLVPGDVQQTGGSVGVFGEQRLLLYHPQSDWCEGLQYLQ